MEQGQAVLLTSVTWATPASRPRLHSPGLWVSGRRGLRSALLAAPPRLEQEPVSQQVAPAASDWLSGLAANTGNWSTGHSAKTGISSMYLINRVLSRGLARSLAQSPGPILPTVIGVVSAGAVLSEVSHPVPRHGGTSACTLPGEGERDEQARTGSKSSSGRTAQPGSFITRPERLSSAGAASSRKNTSVSLSRISDLSTGGGHSGR